MATLYITGYLDAKEVALGPIQFRAKVSIGGAAAGSGALGVEGTSYRIRVVGDVACQIERGATPSADAESEYMPANSVEYFHLDGGHEVSVIAQQ